MTTTLQITQDKHTIEEQNETEVEIDIAINNVVCSFSVGCKLNFSEIAKNGRNVEKAEKEERVKMKLRKPFTLAWIWESGRISCTGAKSENQVGLFTDRSSITVLLYI